MGFGGWQPHEFEALDVVHAVATAVVEHGEAVGHWIDYTGDEPHKAVATFAEAYLGRWASLGSYAEELVDQTGLTIQVEPQSWAHYVSFDYAALARDLEVELATAPADDGAIHIFDPARLE